MASALDSGMEGVAAFTQDYQRLVDTAKEIQPDLRCVLLSPLGRRSDQSRTTQADRSVLNAYTKAVNQVADKNNGVFIDLSHVAIDDGLRKDPIHLNDAGYREAAVAIGQALGFDDKWISNAHVEALRSTILKKNVWWFHRSRPANMAYVFGFRKREQGQNAVEIPQYDQAKTASLDQKAGLPYQVTFREGEMVLVRLSPHARIGYPCRKLAPRWSERPRPVFPQAGPSSCVKDHVPLERAISLQESPRVN